MDHFLICQENDPAAALFDPETQIANVLDGEEKFRVVASDLLENIPPNQQARTRHEQDILSPIGGKPILKQAWKEIWQNSPHQDLPNPPVPFEAHVGFPVFVQVLRPDDAHVSVSVQKFNHLLEALVPKHGIGIQNKKVFPATFAYGGIVTCCQADIFFV